MGRWIVQGGLTQKSNAPRFGSFRHDPLVIWRKWCDEYVPSSASLVYDHHKLYQSRLLVRRGEHYECVASDRPSVNPGDGCEMLIIAQICSPILVFPWVCGPCSLLVWPAGCCHRSTGLSHLAALRVGGLPASVPAVLRCSVQMQLRGSLVCSCVLPR